MIRVKKYWRECIIGVLVIILIGVISSKPEDSKANDLEKIVAWQGQKIQELQQKVEQGRIIPTEFISKEQLELWLREQDWIGLNPSWTWADVTRLQQQGFRDGFIISWMIVESLGVTQSWPLVKIGDIVYWIEPVTHEVKQYYPSVNVSDNKSSGFKLPWQK